MRIFTIIFISLLMLNFFDVKSQVSIDGELRPRSEFRQGFKKPLVDTLKPAFVTLQRTRLSIDYKSKILNTRITLQDSRIWGKNDTKVSDSKIEIYEAWAECLLTSGFSLQIGRQALKYDDQRLLGAANWSNTGNAHDIMLLKYKPSNLLEFHGGFAYNNSKDTTMEVNYTIPKMYKSMGFLWASKNFNNGFKTTAIAVEEGLQNPGNVEVIHSRFTGGINLSYQNDSSNLYFSLLGYYQIGKNAKFDNLEAYMCSAKLGLRFLESNSLFVAVDYYSGTRHDGAPGSSHTFNKLYGANHSFNGNMEFWSSIPKPGLIDYYIGFTKKITQKFSADASFHVFNFAQKYLINNEEIDKNVGSELDVILNYNVSKEITIQGGYCMYFENTSTKSYFAIDASTFNPLWAYLMLTIKPNFYKTPPPVENK